MANIMCNPTEHDFVRGGDGEGEYEAWIFCKKCGAIMMVPTLADQPGVIYAPKLKTNGE